MLSSIDMCQPPHSFGFIHLVCETFYFTVFIATKRTHGNSPLVIKTAYLQKRRAINHMHRDKHLPFDGSRRREARTGSYDSDGLHSVQDQILSQSICDYCLGIIPDNKFIVLILLDKEYMM